MQKRAMWTRAWSALALAGLMITTLSAQPKRPQATVTAVTPASAVAPGTTVTLDLKVVLPPDVHVQADKPSDPLFIPTVLTVDVPNGLTLEGIVYPPSQPLTQKGVKEPLRVFGSEFTIHARVKVASNASAGTVTVPARLRYQACDDTTCYPPARADASWTVGIAARQ